MESSLRKLPWFLWYQVYIWWSGVPGCGRKHPTGSSRSKWCCVSKRWWTEQISSWRRRSQPKYGKITNPPPQYSLWHESPFGCVPILNQFQTTRSTKLTSYKASFGNTLKMQQHRTVSSSPQTKNQMHVNHLDYKTIFFLPNWWTH